MTKEEAWRRSYNAVPKGGFISSQDYMSNNIWQHWIKSSMKNSPYISLAETGIGYGGTGIRDTECRTGKFTLQHYHLNQHAECQEDEIVNYNNPNCQSTPEGGRHPVKCENEYYSMSNNKDRRMKQRQILIGSYFFRSFMEKYFIFKILFF